MITYLTKMTNAANQIHINEKSYPVTSISNNFKYASYQKGKEHRHIEVVFLDPSFATLDMNSLALKQMRL